MEQWQGESRRQSQTLKRMCDISQLEYEANKNAETDLSVNAPTFSHSVQNLSEENVEQIRKTMIRQAELFKEQVLALHKLYNIQRSLMHEIQKVAHFQAKCSSLSTDAIQIHDNQASGSAIKRIAFELGSGHISDHAAENPTVFGVIHKIISDARHTEEEFAKRQNALRAGDKVVIDSAVRKSTIRRSLDLERPPEDYMDGQETETTEVERSSEQGTTLFSEALDNLNIHLESNEKASARIGVEEKTANGMQRQLFRTDPRGLSEKNQIDKQMSVKWIKSADDGIHWPAGMELATIVQEGWHVSLPESVQVISGRKWLPKQESKVDLEISSQKETAIEHGEDWRKVKCCVVTELSNELSQTNALLTSAISNESDSTQKSSCRQVSAFTRCNQVGSSKESFGSGKETSSSPKDIKLSGILPTIARKDLNKEAEHYTGLSKTQNVLIRQPAVAESHSSVRTSQTMAETTCEEIEREDVQVSIHRDTDQLSSVIFPRGYSDGATILAFGSQLSLEGHPAVAAQGFLFPTSNNDTVMKPVPYLASPAWYPQNSYFQLYHYHQQAAQDQGFRLPIQGLQQTWTHNRKGREDGENDISGEPASLPTCFRSSADLTQQSQEGSSSVNWHSGSPQLQELKFAPQKSHLKNPPELLVTDDDLNVDLKLATQEDQSRKYPEGQIPTAIKDQDISKLNGTQEKTLINEKVSSCSNYAIEILEGKEHKEEETNTSPKIELQDTNITKKQTILDASHNEYSAVEGVPLGQKREPNMLLDKKAESGAILLGNQHSDEQLHTTLWMQGKKAQPSESLNVEGIMSRITRQEMLLPSLYKDDISFQALETKNYASIMLSSNVNDKSLHKEKACKDSDHIENHKVLYPNGSLKCKTTNGLADEKVENNDDPRSSGVEPLRLNQKECTWIERRSHSDGLSSKDSTSSVLQRDVASGKPLEHQHVMKEAHSMVTTHNDNCHNSLVSRLVVGEQHAVTKVESLPGVVSMENTRTDRLRLSQEDEHVTKSLRDIQSTSQDLQTRQGIHAQYTSIQTSSCRQQLELQGSHSRMETVSLEEDLSEATESAQESSANSKGSEENSEEEAASEEACEKLAARILLSLAPTASPDKNKSMINNHSLHQFQSPKLTGIQQPEQFGFTSTQTGQMENRSHAVADLITIPWRKSIRRKRHRTRRIPSQFTSLGNHQCTSV